MQFLYTRCVYIYTGILKGTVMNVNFITTYNPFATGPLAYNLYAYQTPQLMNFTPLFSFGGGFDASQYFGTMPIIPQPQFNFDELINNFYKSFQTSASNIQNLFNSAVKPSALPPFGSITSHSTTTSNFLTTPTASNIKVDTTLADDTESELKPGLFKGRLAGQEALVTKISKKYGVSPALVASIIGLESGWGTSALAMHNNFGGYRAAGDLGKNEKGFGYFSTIEKGLDAMIKNLAGYTRYSDVAKVDFENLDSIGRHYCEGGTWATKVKQVYNTRVSNYLA